MQEIHAIQAELHGSFGAAGKTSFSYIVNVLRQAGTLVDMPTGGTEAYLYSSLEEPYATRLKGLLQFGNLELAERSLHDLDTAYREYSAAADHAGMNSVRRLALKGKLRAQNLSANPRVSADKRQEKHEIASWFRVWLQSPDLFSDWLELRKNSEEFQRNFATRDRERSSE